MGEVGFDAEMKSVGTWDYENERWGIDGLRHILRPTLRYRYLPGGKGGRNKIIPIDKRVFSTSLPAIGLGNIRNVDDLNDLNVLRFGWENLFQTRHPTYGSRNLLELNFYQDLRFSAEGGEQEWSDWYTQLAFTPISWLRFDLYNRFNPETLTLEENRTRLSLIDGDIWEVGVFTDSLQNEFDQYGLDFSCKLSERWGFQTQFRFDAYLEDLTEQIYAFWHRLGHAWEVEYRVTLYTGNSRQSSADFSVGLRLLQF